MSSNFEEMDFCQLIEYYRENPHDDVPDWFDEWFDAIYNSFPMDQLVERLDAIEATLDIILAKIGSQQASINVRELIRLKGGYR